MISQISLFCRIIGLTLIYLILNYFPKLFHCLTESFATFMLLFFFQFFNLKSAQPHVKVLFLAVG